MVLPTRGQRDWDDELNNEIQRLDSDVQSAVTDASSAVSNANSARTSADAAAASAAQSASAAETAAASATAPTDETVAAKVNDASSQTHAALSATLGRQIKQETSTEPHRAITLAGGQGDETVSGYFATVTDDTVNYTIGDRAKKAVTGRTGNTFGVRFDYATPLTFPGEDVDAIGMRVYIPDVTKVSALYCDIYQDAAFTFADAWRRDSSHVPQPLVNGWNTLRWPAHISTRAANWGSVYRVQIMGYATAADAQITVGHVWAEARRKATLLFINDGPYADFLTYGYPGLKERGFPVTWSIDPSLLGTTVNSGGIDMPRMTEAELDAVAFENGNSVSAHAWGDIETSGMTAAQIRADAMRTTKWLQGKNYSGWVWRSSWWGENAPQYAAAKPYYLSMSTYKSDTGVTPWPPVDPFNIPRYSLYSTRTNTDLDTMFEYLRTTKGHLAPFTHRVAPNPGQYDFSLTQWDYFLSKIDEGVSGGWLEGVTFETLFARSGGRFTPGMYGAQVAEYVDESGEVVRKRLP